MSVKTGMKAYSTVLEENAKFEAEAKAAELEMNKIADAEDASQEECDLGDNEGDEKIARVDRVKPDVGPVENGGVDLNKQSPEKE